MSNSNAIGVSAYAGTPVNGTNEVQRVTLGGTPSGGTFTLTFDGFTTAAITWSATTNTLLTNVKNALEALPNIDTVTCTDVDLSSGVGNFDIEFSGANVGKKDQNTLTYTSSLTGSSPTIAIAVQTAGVTATYRNAETGKLLVDITNGILYQNVSTTLQAPSWARVGGLPSVEALTQNVTYDEFTDGGAAIGTFTFDEGSIPVGAIVLHSKVIVDAGFAGDTSAALTIGDGTDADRYNTSTINVFATAANGVAAGNVSGVAYHDTAKTPVLTVTTDSDWGNVSAGELTVTIYYIRTV